MMQQTLRKRKLFAGSGSGKQPACKPGSVRWFPIATVISLGVRSLALSSSLPAASLSRWILSPLLGLAPAGVCRAAHVATSAVGSYSTFSPLPLSRRFVFCGTFRHDDHSSCPGVTWQPYPRSPDFPRFSITRTLMRDHPADQA